MSTLEGYLYFRLPPDSPLEDDDAPAPPPKSDEEIFESRGDKYVRKYVSLDIYIGLKFRNHQPSFLSGDDDECESDRDLDSDDPTNDPNSIMYRPKDHWKYAFGGDVSLTKMEPKGHIKAKGKSKSHKKLYPIMLLTKVNPRHDEQHIIKHASSWVTFAAESKEEMHKWIQLLRKARDITQYMRACRDCNQATPLKVIINACATGDWKSLSFENIRLTNSSICALAVFFKRQINSAIVRTKNTTEIIINNCGLSDDSCQVLLNIFETIPSLERIRMPNNEIGDKGVRFLASSPVLQSGFIELDLSQNHLTSHSAQRLSEVIENCDGAMKKLDLSNNNIKIDGIIPLLRAIRESSCPLEVLTLNGNEVGDVGGVLVSEIMKKNRNTIRIIRCARCKINSRGVKAIANAMHYCKNLLQVKLHGNIAKSDSIGYVIWRATQHHFSQTKSRLAFSVGGSEGIPTEHPLHGREVKGFFANVERSTYIGNLRLRRRGIPIVRSEMFPHRVTIWFRLEGSNEVEVSMFRVRIAGILGINPPMVHITSTLKESSTVMCVGLEICAPHKVVKNLSLLAAQNDPKLRSMGVLRVAEYETASAITSSESMKPLSPNSNFEQFLNSSLVEITEEKKMETGDDDTNIIKNSVHPQIEIIDLPPLLPKRLKDMNYRREGVKPAPEETEVTTRKHPGSSMDAHDPGVRVSFEASPPPPPPGAPDEDGVPPPPSSDGKVKGVASMAKAYSLAADFFGDEDDDILPPPPPSAHVDDVSAPPAELPPPPPIPSVSSGETGLIPVIEEDEGEEMDDEITADPILRETLDMLPDGKTLMDLGVPPPPPAERSSSVTAPPPDRMSSTVAAPDRASSVAASPPPPAAPPGAPPPAPTDSTPTHPPALRKKTMSRSSTNDYTGEWKKAEISEMTLDRDRAASSFDWAEVENEAYRDERSFSNVEPDEDTFKDIGVAPPPLKQKTSFGSQGKVSFNEEENPTRKKGLTMVTERTEAEEEDDEKDDDDDQDDDDQDDDGDDFFAKKRALSAVRRASIGSDLDDFAVNEEQDLSGFDNDSVADHSTTPSAPITSEPAQSDADDVTKAGAAKLGDNEEEDEFDEDEEHEEDEDEDEEAADTVEDFPATAKAMMDEGAPMERTSLQKARERARSKAHGKGTRSNTSSIDVHVHQTPEEIAAHKAEQQQKADHALMRAVSNLADQAEQQSTSAPTSQGEYKDNSTPLPSFMEKRRDLCKAVGSRSISEIEDAIRAVKEDYLHGGNKWQEVKLERKRAYYWNRITGKTQFEKPKGMRDAGLESVSKFLSQLHLLTQDFQTLHVVSSSDKLLEQYQSFMCRCAVLGFNGQEAQLAYQQISAHIMELISKGEIDPNSEAYGMIHIKSQIVYTMINRGAHCVPHLTTFLQQLVESRKAGSIKEGETTEESIAKIFLKRCQQLEKVSQAALASDRDVLKTVETAILQSYLMNHLTPTTVALENKRAEVGAEASVILEKIFEAAKNKNIFSLKKKLAEAKRIGFHAPGLQEAENLLELQHKLSSEKQAKEAIARAAKAIKGGRLAAANTAELIPVLRLLEGVNLETDKTTTNNIKEVQRYLSKLTGHDEKEKKILSILSRGDVKELSDFLEGKGEGELVVAAAIKIEMEDWVMACNKAGNNDEYHDNSDSETVSSSQSSMDLFSRDKKGEKEAAGTIWKKGMLVKTSRGKKTGDVTSSWKERYCVLQGSTLTYYAVSSDKRTKQKKGSLIVHSAIDAKSAGEGDVWKKPNTFIIREGRDLSDIDTMLMHEARKQLKGLQKVELEHNIMEGLNSRDAETIRVSLKKIEEFGIDVKEELIEEAKDVLLDEDRSLAKVELKKAIEKCSRSMISENLAKCESLGVDKDHEIMVEARDMVKYTEIELNLQRMRVALEQANGKNFDIELQSIKSNANATEDDKEGLAALILEHSMRVLRDNMMSGAMMGEEVRALRQTLSTCLAMRVEIGPMQLLRLGLNAFGEEESGKSKTKNLRLSMFGIHGGGNMINESPYSLDKCALLKEIDAEAEEAKGGKKKFSSLVKSSMMFRSSGAKARGGTKRMSRISGMSVASVASSSSSQKNNPLRSIYTEGRMNMNECLTKGIIDSPGGEVGGLELFGMVKSVVIQRMMLMSDDSSTSSGAGLGGRNYAEIAVKIVSDARSNPAIGVEVYMQLCKLMASHGDNDRKADVMQSSEVKLRCWVLMAFLLRCVVVDGNLKEHLKFHLSQLQIEQSKNNLSTKMMNAMGKSQRKSFLSGGGSFVSIGGESVGGGGGRRRSGWSGGGKGEISAPSENLNLKKVSKYCVKCLGLQEKEGMRFCSSPNLKVAQNLFEEEKLGVKIGLMNGREVTVPVMLIFTDTPYPLLTALENEMSGSNPNMTLPKIKMQFQKRWNGFSLYVTDGVSKSKLDSLSLSPYESESVNMDFDIAWESTRDEYQTGKKKIVLRVRTFNRGEVRSNDFVPPVLQSDDYNKDVMTAMSLWEAWLKAGIKGVHGGLPEDSTRLSLMVAEEMRKVEAGCYNIGDGWEGFTSYLTALYAAITCDEKDWAEGWAGGADGSKAADGQIVKDVLSGLIKMDYKCPSKNAHLKYLLTRAWLDYAKSNVLFGGHFLKAKLIKNSVVAMSTDVQLVVNGDGLFLLIDGPEKELLFSCRHTHVDEVRDTVDGRLRLSFTGINLELDITQDGWDGKQVAALIASTCNDVLWEGSFLDGTGLGSCDNEEGVLNQREILQNFLHEYPLLVRPPKPPSLVRNAGSFPTPESDRGKWVLEAREAEKQAQIDARELSEKQAQMEQEQMEKAGEAFAKMQDDDDEDAGGRGSSSSHHHGRGLKKQGSSGALKDIFDGMGLTEGKGIDKAKIKRGWGKLRTITRLVGQVGRRHQLNSTIFGVPGEPPKVNYHIPDPPSSIRKFGMGANTTRQLGGVLTPPEKPRVTKICMPSELPAVSLSYPSREMAAVKKLRSNTAQQSMKSRATLSFSGGKESAEDLQKKRRNHRTSSVRFGRSITDITEARGTFAGGLGGSIVEEGGDIIEEGEEEDEEDHKVVEEPIVVGESAAKLKEARERAKSNHTHSVSHKAAALSEIWECRMDPSSGYAFYFNKISQTGSWTPPEGYVPTDQGVWVAQYQALQQHSQQQQQAQQQQQHANAWANMTEEQKTYYMWWQSLTDDQKQYFLDHQHAQ